MNQLTAKDAKDAKEKYRNSFWLARPDGLLALAQATSLTDKPARYCA
jgi:hypothetical protein